MHANCQNLSGRRFGRLTVISRGRDSVSPAGNRSVKWACVCDCGGTKEAMAGNLRTGKTTSCGCVQREATTTHGNTAHLLFKTWRAMLLRCYDPRTNGFESYGGRGIVVCDRWRNDFQAFVQDMGPKPDPADTIHRKDNDADYSPENCVWATIEEQSNHKRNSVRVTHCNLNMSVAQWSRLFGLSSGAIGGLRRKRRCTWEAAISHYVEKL